MNNKVSNTPVLYSFRRCPFAMRARAALYYSNIKVILREVVLNNKPEAMIRSSKKATVPVLVLKDRVIDESLEIIIWALKINDKLNLLSPYFKEKEKTIELIHLIDNHFKFHLDRYKYSSRYETCKNFKSKYSHRDEAANHLSEIEEMLKKNKSLYLYNNKLSIIDLCIFPLIRQFRIADEKWFDNNSNFNFIQKWLANILKLEFFNIIMKKYKPWNINSQPEFFL